jgi:hypothetical protein
MYILYKSESKVKRLERHSLERELEALGSAPKKKKKFWWGGELKANTFKD